MRPALPLALAALATLAITTASQPRRIVGQVVNLRRIVNPPAGAAPLSTSHASASSRHASASSRDEIAGHQFTPINTNKGHRLIRVHRRSSAADHYLSHHLTERSALRQNVGQALSPANNHAVGQPILAADSLSSESSRPHGRPQPSRLLNAHQFTPIGVHRRSSAADRHFLSPPSEPWAERLREARVLPTALHQPQVFAARDDFHATPRTPARPNRAATVRERLPEPRFTPTLGQAITRTPWVRRIANPLSGIAPLSPARAQVTPISTNEGNGPMPVPPRSSAADRYLSHRLSEPSAPRNVGQALSPANKNPAPSASPSWTHQTRPQSHPILPALPTLSTRPLLLAQAYASTSTPTLPRPAPTPAFPSPIELALSPNGTRLYVLCEGTNEVLEINSLTGATLRRVRTGDHPKSISLSPDGRSLFVANSWSDTVSLISTESFRVLRELPAGFEPNAAISDAEGRFLYVANRISHDISVVDIARGVETKRLLAGRGAAYLALSPDGRRIYCTHIYPLPGAFRTPPESEVTIVDTRRQIVVERERLTNSAGVFHIASANQGRLLIAAQLRPKNLIPLAHVEHGWVFSNSLALFGPDLGETVHIPLDELDRYFTPPFALAVSPDSRYLYVSTTGSDSVTVVDLPKLLAFVRAASPEQRRSLANDLSASANYVAARIPVGQGPKGIVLSPDGKRLFVANRTGDSISAVDTLTRRVAATFPLTRGTQLTPERRGERLFYSARFAFQGHFGCANCHLEATLDGLNWDLEPDGFGIDIVDNRLLEDVSETAPYKWNGGNPDLETECGPRTEKYFYRAQSYSTAELADLVAFIKAIPSRPNRFRRKDGELTAQQQRGLSIFTRTLTKSGKQIDYNNQCAVCHSGTRYTNLALADVGTGKSTDRSPRIDVPQLNNILLSAPYLHDGSAPTLEEIWTVFNPADKHGVTNDLSKDELNDLIEYLKTL